LKNEGEFMSNLKKLQDEYANISEFKNVRLGQENHLYTKLKDKESTKNSKAIEIT
jgi:hypothetical protein